jgi:hypothetical protein
MTAHRSAAHVAVVLLCLLVMAFAITTGSALASNYRPPKPVTISAKFKVAGEFAAVSNGAFAFEQTSDLSGSGILIDQANGRQYTVPGFPGCTGLTNWTTRPGSIGAAARRAAWATSRLTNRRRRVGVSSTTGARPRCSAHATREARHATAD